MQDRVDDAITYYNSFLKYYNESEFIEDLKLKFEELNKLKTT
jgi:hypothetical protein